MQKFAWQIKKNCIILIKKNTLKTTNRYENFFSPNEKHVILGEATPIYMYWKESVSRIYEYNPDMKLIVILRNPIERAYSHWNMERIKKNENLSFMDAIANEELRCREALPYQHRFFSYIDRGRYLEQIQRIWQFFPKKKVLILKSEELKNDPTLALNQVADFLGIDQFENIEKKMIHARPYTTQMTTSEKDFLKKIFSSEIRMLEKALKWDCSKWIE